MNVRGRFAPSTTGPGHPGTLLAALLAWCDAKSRQGRVLLRLEDLDPQRCKPRWAIGLRQDLTWLGLDWDEVAVQSRNHAQHAAALDALAGAGALYACTCSRADLQAYGRRAPDGAWVYPNTCRAQRLRPSAWRACPHPLRAALPSECVWPKDVGGIDLRQNPAEAMGDPIVRRRDGAVAYQLAVVVDDAAWGVNHVVRGRDIATSTAVQGALHSLLGLTPPTYRHHFLLCEPQGDKLGKMHGSVSADLLRQNYRAPALVGFLAHAAGLRANAAPCAPRDLLADFSWDRVRVADLVVCWDGAALRAA